METKERIRFLLSPPVTQTIYSFSPFLKTEYLIPKFFM